MPTVNGTSNSIDAAVDGQNTDSGPGVLGQTAGKSPASGVMGSSVNGRGVTGESGTEEGVLGTSHSGAGVMGTSSGIGVLGRGSPGVLGECSNPNGAGVQGLSNVGPDSIGVFGTSTGGTGIKGQTFSGTGVLGASAGGIAVHGINTGSSGLAGSFEGAVEINGTLTKAAGSFKIDHPLDPENKYLRHSFIESPDMMNIYSGIVILDNHGKAIVSLPAWFEALNQDIRYGLTPIGAPAPNLYVAREVENNSFEIAGGSPGLKISWQLTGIRRDPYAELNRIEVESDKPLHERGRYLHPREYGLPEAMGIYRHSNIQANLLSAR